MKNDIYAEKKRFVDLLSEAYELDGSVKKIIYTRDAAACNEIVHLEYTNGRIDRINVTGNSHTAIGMEVARQLYSGNAVGLIR